MDQRRAQGVTTPLRDVGFGTRLRGERVRVSRRLAVGWLGDVAGQLHAAYAADCERVGSARKGVHSRRRRRRGRSGEAPPMARVRSAARPPANRSSAPR